MLWFLSVFWPSALVIRLRDWIQVLEVSWVQSCRWSQLKWFKTFGLIAKTRKQAFSMYFCFIVVTNVLKLSRKLEWGTGPVSSQKWVGSSTCCSSVSDIIFWTRFYWVTSRFTTFNSDFRSLSMWISYLWDRNSDFWKQQDIPVFSCLLNWFVC